MSTNTISVNNQLSPQQAAYVKTSISSNVVHLSDTETITGSKTFTMPIIVGDDEYTSIDAIKSITNEASLNIIGGNSLENGANLKLYGINYSSNTDKGSFSITSTNGTNTYTLKADNTGSLTWNNNKVITVNDIATSSNLGVIKVDNDTITIDSDGIISSVGSKWGKISGTLSSQADLNTALTNINTNLQTEIDTSVHTSGTGSTTIPGSYTFTGNNAFNNSITVSSTPSVKQSSSSSYLELRGGTTVSNGALCTLYGTSYSISNLAGSFSLISRNVDTNTEYTLIGDKNGSLTWNNHNIITDNNLATSSNLGVVKVDNTSITVTSDGTISAVDSVTWGNITGTLSNQTDLQSIIGDTTQLPTPTDGLSENIADVSEALDTLSNNVVHTSGNETINGHKTFNNGLTGGTGTCYFNTINTSQSGSNFIIASYNDFGKVFLPAGYYAVGDAYFLINNNYLFLGKDGELSWKAADVITADHLFNNTIAYLHWQAPIVPRYTSKWTFSTDHYMAFPSANSADYEVILYGTTLDPSQYTIDLSDNSITFPALGNYSAKLTIKYLTGKTLTQSINLATSSNVGVVKVDNNTITVSSDGTISANTQLPTIVTDTTSTTITLDASANTRYTYGELSTFNLSFPSTGTAYQEIHIMWTSGSTATVFNLTATNCITSSFTPSANNICECDAIWNAHKNKWIVKFIQTSFTA